MKCRKCGNDILETDKFCIRCGTPTLTQPENCPSCGIKLRQGEQFCHECGADIMALWDGGAASGRIMNTSEIEFLSDEIIAVTKAQILTKGAGSAADAGDYKDTRNRYPDVHRDGNHDVHQNKYQNEYQNKYQNKYQNENPDRYKEGIQGGPADVPGYDSITGGMDSERMNSHKTKPDMNSGVHFNDTDSEVSVNLKSNKILSWIISFFMIVCGILIILVFYLLMRH